ncbi:MAG: DUF1189 domain-containing protein [Pseudomonadota bacterium]|nr:DUF1189 domain-containing protein [Pseudomonadota bacterium]
MKDIIKSLPLTFYSSAFYRELAAQWTGIGLGFMVVLTIFGVLSFAYQTHAPVVLLADQIVAALDAMPEASFKGGKLSIDAPTPFVKDIMKLPDPAHGGAVMPNKLMIDPSYRVDDVEALTSMMNRDNIMILVTDTKVAIRKSGGHGVEVDDLSMTPDGVFTHEKWASLAHMVHIWLFPALLAMGIVGIFVATFVLTLFVAVLMQIISLILQADMTFAATLRLTAAAGIPPGLLAAAVNTPFLAKLVLWLGFGVFGLLSAKPPKRGPPIAN